MSEQLSMLCPNFYSHKDMLMAQAQDLLRGSGGMPPPKQILKEAVVRLRGAAVGPEQAMCFITSGDCAILFISVLCLSIGSPFLGCRKHTALFSGTTHNKMWSTAWSASCKKSCPRPARSLLTTSIGTALGYDGKKKVCKCVLSFISTPLIRASPFFTDVGVGVRKDTGAGTGREIRTPTAASRRRSGPASLRSTAQCLRCGSCCAIEHLLRFSAFSSQNQKTHRLCTLFATQLFHPERGALTALYKRYSTVAPLSKEKQALTAELNEQIRAILLSDDELAHYELFAWLMRLGEDQRLVEVSFNGAGVGRRAECC